MPLCKGNQSNWSRKAENAVFRNWMASRCQCRRILLRSGMSGRKELEWQPTLASTREVGLYQWGAGYAEFKQPVSSEIAYAESGIKVRRVIVPADSQGRGTSKAKVGEKVKVILTIIADRDYDFVKIVDQAGSLSGACQSVEWVPVGNGLLCLSTGQYNKFLF